MKSLGDLRTWTNPFSGSARVHVSILLCYVKNLCPTTWKGTNTKQMRKPRYVLRTNNIREVLKVEHTERQRQRHTGSIGMHCNA